MEAHARLFNCLRCHAQVVICRACDRGNIYCQPICARSARTESLRASNKRYQKTPRGRLLHAKRQQRYKQRIKAKVTYQGSHPLSLRDVLFSSSNKTIQHRHAPIKKGASCCHFCCEGDFALFRNDFLYRVSAKKIKLSAWPCGP